MTGKRLALVVGVSTYHRGFDPLPWAREDAAAMAEILSDPAIGGYEVTKLIDPHREQLAAAIEFLFTERRPEDVLVFYFSGHGVKDELGRLHLAVPQTSKRANGLLYNHSALPAADLLDCMERSRSDHQIVILDSCFSGAFAEGMAAKDDRSLDFGGQFAVRKGRAVLTATSATGYAFGAHAGRLSAYTHFLVEGIRSGDADTNRDSFITVDELHEYAKVRMMASGVAMTPSIFSAREGYHLAVARAPQADPRAIYRSEVELLVRNGGGLISETARRVLNRSRAQLRLEAEIASSIESEILAPYRAHEAQVAALREAVRGAGVAALAADRLALERYRQQLGLGSDVLERLIEEEKQREHESPTLTNRGERPEPMMSRSSSNTPWIAAGAVLGLMIALFFAFQASGESNAAEPTGSARIAGSLPGAVAKPAPSPPSDPGGSVPRNQALTTSHWIVRVSADSALSEAERNARRVASSNVLGHSLAVQILRRDSLYYVVVGNYSSERMATADRMALRSILGEGAIVHSMASWCPRVTSEGNVLACSG